MEYITLWVLIFVSITESGRTEVFNTPKELFDTAAMCEFQADHGEKYWASYKLTKGVVSVLKNECREVTYLTEIE